MLEPGSPVLYLEALKPKPGYVLDRAIGTAYSVDLSTLLMVPLACAQLDRGDSREALSDPVALLHYLRSFAKAVVVFCQEDRIAAPNRKPPTDRPGHPGADRPPGPTPPRHRTQKIRAGPGPYGRLSGPK